MQILDGRIVSQSVKDRVKEKVILFKKAGKKTPHLAAVLVGTNGASETYVASKVKNCEEVGFKSSLIRFDENISESALIASIEARRRSRFRPGGSSANSTGSPWPRHCTPW